MLMPDTSDTTATPQKAVASMLRGSATPSDVRNYSQTFVRPNFACGRGAAPTHVSAVSCASNSEVRIMRITMRLTQNAWKYSLLVTTPFCLALVDVSTSTSQR